MERAYVRPEKEAIESYKKIFGISGQNYSIGEILEAYDNLYRKNKNAGLIQPKNELVRLAVMESMESIRHFKNTYDFKGDVCASCNGFGELYRFTRKSVQVPCTLCGGKTGVLKVDCTDCEGTGKFQRRNGSTTVCHRCKGTKRVIITCPNCHGTLKETVLQRQKMLDKTTPCKACKEVGFVHGSSPSNPVLTKDLAATIITKPVADEQTLASAIHEKNP